MAKALKPGGRFVVEFGGRGNIGGIAHAVRAAISEVLARDVAHSWYFPSISDYTGLLEKHGLAVSAAWLFDRPTPLEGADGMRNWITMFGGGMFARYHRRARQRIIETAEAKLFPTHFKDGRWHADYRRIRVIASKAIDSSKKTT